MPRLYVSQFSSAAVKVKNEMKACFFFSFFFWKSDRWRIISSSKKLSAQPVREGKAIILIIEVGDVHYFCCTLCLSLLVMCNLFYSYYNKHECQARDIRQFWGLIMGFLELFTSVCAWNTAKLSCDWNFLAPEDPLVTQAKWFAGSRDTPIVDRPLRWLTAHSWDPCGKTSSISNSYVRQLTDVELA